jgi:hypothetical protein
MYSADQIADELVLGLNSTWESPEQGDPLPFEDLTVGNVPIGDAIASRAFTDLIARAIAEDRMSDADLDPTITHGDRLQALRVAEDVREALIERGHRDAATADVAWWGPERDALLESRPLEDEASTSVSGTDRPGLRARMEDAYLAGYDERIRSGLAWSDAVDNTERNAVGDNVLAGKRAAYVELDALTATLRAELPDGLARFNDPSVDEEPLTSNASVALERSAHLAGRWGGVDAGLDGALARIENQVLEVPQVESIHAGDSRDAWFEYRQDRVDAARAALPQIERHAAERSPGVSAADPESTDERKTVLERMRGWREARREASGRTGVDDVDRRRDAWQTAHGREMRTAGTAQRAPQRDVAQPAIDRGIER